MVFQKIDEIIIEDQDGLSLFSGQKVQFGTHVDQSLEGFSSLELNKDLFESIIEGNKSNRAPPRVEGEIRIRQNPY
jgi:hypothetical protein